MSSDPLRDILTESGLAVLSALNYDNMPRTVLLHVNLCGKPHACSTVQDGELSYIWRITVIPFQSNLVGQEREAS